MFELYTLPSTSMLFFRNTTDLSGWGEKDQLFRFTFHWDIDKHGLQAYLEDPVMLNKLLNTKRLQRRNDLSFCSEVWAQKRDKSWFQIGRLKKPIIWENDCPTYNDGQLRLSEAWKQLYGTNWEDVKQTGHKVDEGDCFYWTFPDLGIEAGHACDGDFIYKL